LKVKDLYLGEVEGAEEFKTKEAIEQLYFLNIGASMGSGLEF